ncbi:MAG: shikimate kinase [Syntrophobacteraceae bacterium]|jgi:shikimate kinase|nr:shikimate kinase [Syntrophobacteraceae bacterium]
MKPRIAIIGFRATGKSLLGRKLAARLGWSFVDMDDELVASLGMSIQEWVELHGWEAFRREESRLLADLAGRDRLVVATGGGVVLEPGNRTTLRESFEVVWLRARQTTILSRIRSDDRSAGYRPPLTSLPLEQEIEVILKERLPLYAETADHALEVDGLAPEAIAQKLLEWARSVDDSMIWA